MIVGCFTLDLYCDTEGCRHNDEGKGCQEPDSYVRRTRAECNRAARKDGWKIWKGKVICSKCVEAKKGKIK